MNTKQFEQSPATRPYISKDGRHCYAYILYVGNNINSVVGLDWWNTKDVMRNNKCAMAATSRRFKKTSWIAVYELREDKNYHFCDSCEQSGNYPINEVYSPGDLWDAAKTYNK